ncbi:MAG TPA: [Fe-Fe] hydrogenase large subunit C-terminal domain-containing protein [Candidatus Cloacimonadota bacterium]|nr:[Fe-Fe] hydrogenase large subunit C-terminal domain-containing protein [Candidatus Cloacimonadota bacterium]HPT73014.1 [Fe-Fe] hydrogenase large subunit C-terminal domain-containing protein [Candidatus Cloacimonadota bacterium]
MSEKPKEYFHAIHIVSDLCTGCTACVRVCPTEAIRVRHGKAEIDPQRCIDCGQCVTSCSFHAIVPRSDSLEIIKKFKYKIAIIASSYGGQFTEDISYPTAKKALLTIGFDDVAEEAFVTDFMISLIRSYIRENREMRPILSSNCPAVVRLIQVKFPSLLPNLLHVEAPMSILTQFMRERAKRLYGFDDHDIGIFLIVPCVAQVTAVHQPEGTYKRLQDGAFSIGMIYGLVREKLKKMDDFNGNIDTYENGLSWALSGVESDLVDTDDIRALSVNGIDNVINILSRVEDHYLDQYDYIVLRSCTNGCVGGGLNVENPFVAMSRIKKMMKNAQHKELDFSEFVALNQKGAFIVQPLEQRSIMELDKDFKQALTKMKKLNEILIKLPGLNCSACGSPTCYALAEDIVQGKAELEDCVVLLRKMNYDDDNKKGDE